MNVEECPVCSKWIEKMCKKCNPDFDLDNQNDKYKMICIIREYGRDFLTKLSDDTKIKLYKYINEEYVKNHLKYYDNGMVCSNGILCTYPKYKEGLLIQVKLLNDWFIDVQ